MLHPSYTDLMAVVNSDVEPGEQPVVQSRYSIVLATAKRARQLISGQEPLVRARGKEIKPLSVAVEELYNAKIKILNEDDANEDDTDEEEQEVTVSEELPDEIDSMENGVEELSEENGESDTGKSESECDKEPESDEEPEETIEK